MQRTTRRTTRTLRGRTVLRAGLLMLAIAAAVLMHAIPSDDTTPPRQHRLADLHVIEIIGGDHRWTVRYPGDDGVLGTSDDVYGNGDVHVPSSVPTEVLLHSEDYIYSWRVPALQFNEVAIPDMEFRLRIEQQGEGTYRLQGGEMCGRPPVGLQGHVVIESDEAYWAAIDALGAE